MTAALRFLFLEPFQGGSHRDFAEGLCAHSRHHITLLTLPDRFWKWRMRGAALQFAERIDFSVDYDGVIVSSLMSLADLKALWQGPPPPMLLYFHENQLSYPLSPGERIDYQYGFTNITSALAAERVLFNSDYHRRAFLSALPDFIRMMPDCRPRSLAEKIAAKSAVAYPGCHFEAGDPALSPVSNEPLIVWNHRWEHDKNPEAFFRALSAMLREGNRFRVALMGESYGTTPEIFGTARDLFSERLIQFGRVAERGAYHDILSQGTVVISTAVQENFGIAVVEAVRHGCLPLLPARLSYPELLPPEMHADFLYTSQAELESKLAAILDHPQAFAAKRRTLAAFMGNFAWQNAIHALDRELEHLGRQHADTKL